MTVTDEAGLQAEDAERVEATAVSGKRSVLVEVNALGFVCGVRLLSPVVRDWDVDTLGDRVRAVASVAHDRFLANRPSRDSRRRPLDEVAAAERRLNF